MKVAKLKRNQVSLAAYAPDIARQWHPTKNGELTPLCISRGSGVVVWWRCEAGHEWQNRVFSRTSNGDSECPICRREVLATTNNLEVKHPELAAQWHSTKNRHLRPSDVARASNRKVWWRCPSEHEWQAAVVERSVGGNGCPVCAGRAVAVTKNFATDCPETAREWHPTKNGTLKPSDVPKGHRKAVWWLCDKGHEWDAPVAQRTQRKPSGCPYCSSRRAGQGNTLGDLYPKVASEWAADLNDGLTPYNVTPGSNRDVWWRCQKSHEWLMKPSARTVQQQGCPYCSGRRVAPDTCLAATHSIVASEWHSSKNGSKTPNDVLPGSHFKAWWRCSSGHEWRTPVGVRTAGHGCPYCHGRKAGQGNTFADLHPDIANEWAADLNGSLTPYDVTAGSKKNVWWRCARGHEWQTTVGARSGGNSCRKCRGQTQTSRAEIRLWCELDSVFGGALWAEKVDGVEIDVFLPSLQIAVELDGAFWHSKREEQDRRKNNFLGGLGLVVLRVRERPLPLLSELDVTYEPPVLTKFTVNLVVSQIARACSSIAAKKAAEAYIATHDFVAEEAYRRAIASLPDPPRDKSFADVAPAAADEWHPRKNRPMLPRQFWPGSMAIVWWRCPEGHEWEAAVASRITRGSRKASGCPFCARALLTRRASKRVRDRESGHIFSSAKKAAEFFGIDHGTVERHCGGRIKKPRFEWAD